MFHSLPSKAISYRVGMFFALCLVTGLILTSSGQAKKVVVRSEDGDRKGRPGASASPAPEDIARELLQIQQRLGGSIVDGREALEGWDAAAGPVAPVVSLPMQLWNHPLASPIAPSENRSVTALRESAWQLDMSAHRLESLDLYPQAEALRTLSSRLREDARRLKGSKDDN